MATSPKSKYPPSSGTKGEGEVSNRKEYWAEQISKADKRWDSFWSDGDAVMDRFMLESKNPGDKYNILYSSTETIKPSLYGQTPKVEVKNRQQDTEDSLKVAAAMLLEQVGQYAVDQLDFDYILQNTVSDYCLPGIGNVWVRYDPKFSPQYDNDNKPAKNEDGTDRENLEFEGIALDYVHFKDWKCGAARYWHEVPWVSRKVYFTKKEATKRFGKEKADKLAYSYNAQDRKDRTGKDEQPKKQAVIEEIWDKTTGEVIWFSADYPDDIIESKPDPLKLQNFFPCPRPMRAVWTTRSMVPKALYSQYKAQAAELDRLTERIRYLTEALKVRGLYDGSQENLALVLDGAGNKMIPVQDWAALMGAGGITGVVQWVPIKEVVQCLSELFKQREICKNEIYEISGFSDIVRGVSKASETLGAQQIKADWATGRLKDMQKEVQRFIRDIIRMFIEIAAEHFNDKTMLIYSGLTIPKPTPEELQMKQQFEQAKQQYPMMAQQAQMQGQPPPPPPQPPPPTQGEIVQQMFQAVLKLVRSEKLRCAAVGIETDSTILPDEQKERADRMQFLSSMGAFLQQAGPMALQYPDMRGLLGGIMMFTLRTFSASRPLEKEFESFQKKLEAQPPTPPPGQEGGDDGAAAAEAQKAVATIKAQSDQATAKINADAKAAETQQRQAAADKQYQLDHEYRMAQIALEREKLDFEKQKTGAEIIADERAVDYEREDKEAEQYAKQADLDHKANEADKDRIIATEEADIDRAREDEQKELDRQQQSEQDEANKAHEAEQKDLDREAAIKQIKAKPVPKPAAKPGGKK